MEFSRKRRLRMEPVLNWMTLPREILVEIGTRVIKSAFIEDFMGFAGVCNSWRAAAKENECAELIKAWPMVPLLMFAEKKKGGHEFYSLSKNKVCMRLHLPLTEGKEVEEVEEVEEVFTGSRDGWFLTRRTKWAAEPGHLLNPFTGSRFSLPLKDGFPVNKALFSYPSPLRWPFALSANPLSTTDFVLVVAVDTHLVFWRPGDMKWSDIETGDHVADQFYTVTYYSRDGKFYAVTKCGRFYVWDPAGPPKARLLELGQDHDLSRGVKYLAETSEGGMILLSNDCSLHRVEVVEGRLRGGSVNDAVFVGKSHAFCLVPPPDSDAIKPGCVYFYEKTGKMFNLGEPRLEQMFWSTSASPFAVDPFCVDPSMIPFAENLRGPAFWVAPSSIPFQWLLGSAS